MRYAREAWKSTPGMRELVFVIEVAGGGLALGLVSVLTAAPSAHERIVRLLGWVLVAGSVFLAVLADQPPLPLCGEARGCVGEARLGLVRVPERIPSWRSDSLVAGVLEPTAPPNWPLRTGGLSISRSAAGARVAVMM